MMSDLTLPDSSLPDGYRLCFSESMMGVMRPDGSLVRHGGFWVAAQGMFHIHTPLPLIEFAGEQLVIMARADAERGAA